MIINNPYAPGIQVAVTGQVLRWKILEIGSWDMVALETKDVLHGLSKDNISQVTVLIFDDIDTWIRPLEISLVAANSGGYCYIDATNIKMGRITGGLFDNATYDNAAINRGYIYIVYKD